MNELPKIGDPWTPGVRLETIKIRPHYGGSFLRWMFRLPVGWVAECTFSPGLGVFDPGGDDWPDSIWNPIIES